MHFKKLLALVLSTMTALAGLMPAQALAWQLSLAGLYNSTNLTTANNGATNTTTPSLTEGSNKSGSGVGGGILISGRMTFRTELQVGLLYLPREMTSNFTMTGSNAGSYTEQWNFNYLQVPVLIRIHLLPLLTIGVGGYFAHAIGDLKETTTQPSGVSLSGVNASNTYSYASQSVPQNDYGLLAAIGLHAPITPRTQFFIDGRYAYGLQNISLPANAPFGSNTNFTTDTNHWRDVEVLAGITFNLAGFGGGGGRSSRSR